MKNIYNLLWSSTLIIIVIVALIHGSCSSELLDQNNSNATTSENFTSSSTQLIKAVNAAYHPLTTAHLYGRTIMLAGFLRSDEYIVKDFALNTAAAGLTGKPGARWASNIWQMLYLSIGRSNTIINADYTSGVPDKTVRDNYIGQAYFLRGFCYWHLINYFGNVPLILKDTNVDDLYLKQSTPEQIWSSVVADFQKAKEMLPVAWTGDDLGRATKGAATAFLGKSYLWQKDWANAETTFREIVASGTYSLLPSTQFNDNFTENNENNAESIFEFQFKGVAAIGWGVDIPTAGTQGHYVIEFAPPTVSPDKGLYVHQWVRDLYTQNNDTIRRNASIIYDYEPTKAKYPSGYGGVPFTTDYAEDITLATSDNVEPIFVKKYARLNLTREQAKDDNLGVNNGINWRVVRYSDVLLMLAEALNENNKTSEAIGFVNQVRDRARITALATSLTQEQVRTAIIEERAMELFSEGHRFLDLVRWDLATQRLGNASPLTPHPKSLIIPPGFYDTHEAVLWIPVSELAANPNLKQNTGY